MIISGCNSGNPNSKLFKTIDCKATRKTWYFDFQTHEFTDGPKTVDERSGHFSCTVGKINGETAVLISNGLHPAYESGYIYVQLFLRMYQTWNHQTKTATFIINIDIL